MGGGTTPKRDAVVQQMTIASSTLYRLAHRVLQPYTRNANTGNCYEIATYLEDLRHMGLTNEDVDELAPLLDDICRRNNGSDKIRSVVARIRKMPCGSGLFVHGKRVVNLLNVSQEDDYGDTADKICVLEDGTEWGESIVGRMTSLQGCKKCISNPTAKRLGCTPEDIALFQRIGQEAIEPHCAEMRSLYGEDMERWPSRVKTRASLAAQQRVASLTAERFQSLSEEEKCRRIDDLFKTKKGVLTAHQLRVVDKECTGSRSYTLAQKDLARGEGVRIVADGVFLRMYLGDMELGYIQVKYNNGCWHYNKKKGRWETSSIHTSWNATAFMTHLFDLTETSHGPRM